MRMAIFPRLGRLIHAVRGGYADFAYTETTIAQIRNVVRDMVDKRARETAGRLERADGRGDPGHGAMRIGRARKLGMRVSSGNRRSINIFEVSMRPKATPRASPYQLKAEHQRARRSPIGGMGDRIRQVLTTERAL